MPEGIDVEAGSPSKASHPKDEVPNVRWEVEDPSEYRPELLTDMGKDQTEFRVFNVSAVHARFPLSKHR